MPLRAASIIGSMLLAVSGIAEGSVYSHGEPTDLEQFMLELINEARANPSAEAARLGIGLNDGLAATRIGAASKQPLAFHPQLIQAARTHSDWMLGTDVFSHTGAGGSTPTERARAVGYPFSAAENIAYYSTQGPLDSVGAVAGSHDGLFKSPGHRTNLMEPTYSVIGLGVRDGDFKGWNAQMVSQSFSEGGESVDSGPFLLGVVFDDKNGNERYDPGEGLEGVRVEPDYGGYFASTSTSGGYAVPLPPMETRSEVVGLPFPVRGVSWDRVRPYDDDYRSRKIREAQNMTVRISWRGGAIGGATTSSERINRPVRFDYDLRGTDGFYFSRTMVAAENVKVDFMIQNPPRAVQSQVASASGDSKGAADRKTSSKADSTKSKKSKGSSKKSLKKKRNGDAKHGKEATKPNAGKKKKQGQQPTGLPITDRFHVACGMLFVRESNSFELKVRSRTSQFMRLC